MGQLLEDLSLRNRSYVFKDRSEAGKLLARRLSASVSPDSLIFAIPAGGVPVGLEIAREFSLPLDLIIVRKIQIPADPEAGFGAVGPDGEVIFNEELLKRLRLTKEEVEAEVQKTRNTLEARNQLFRKGKPFPDLSGKKVILVDDGLASGFTMAEAAKFLARQNVERTTIAVPTAPEGTVKRLLPLADEIYVLNIRTSLPFAVAAAYRNWYDLTDEEVLSLLETKTG